MRWLNEHGDEYIGEWIALDRERLLFHETNLIEVDQQATASGVEYPLYHFIEPKAKHLYLNV
ncbi:MAG: hypothetical protein L0220_10370 [Acidobacteria bacterium]|nr:hypothetical protein [Acidobacteriota bacterium]